MRRNLALLAFLITAPAIVRAQALQSATPGARLDAQAMEIMRQGEVPGMSVAIVRDGAIAWSGAFGVRNAQTGAPVDRNTVFDAASLTKPVFAYTVLRLVDKGILDLDVPIATLRPNPRMQHDPRYQTITPRMVLSHGTGLPNWGGDRLDLSFDPGKGWGYSGEGYVWLSDAIEAKTGMSIETLARRETFEPLGMRHSALAWSDSLEANGTARHNSWGRAMARPRPPADQLGRANAAASLRTTAEDYARFLIAAMNGTGLKPETARQFLSVQNEARDAASYASRPAEVRTRMAWGLGWGLERVDDAGGMRFWHWGDNGPAKAFVMGDASRRAAVVYFANSDNGLAIATPVLALAFPAPHSAVEWLNYQKHDLPSRVAYRAVVRAGLDSGATVAIARHRARVSATADLSPMWLVEQAAQALAGESRIAVADSLFDAVARDYPDSARVWRGRAEMHLGAGDARSALPHYLRASQLSPSDSTLRFRSDWTRAYLSAIDGPQPTSGASHEGLVGRYGPRMVTLENGQLHYQREGGRKYVLRQLTADTFVADGVPIFRLQFVRSGDAAASMVVGHYHDGRRDENARTTP